LEGNKVTLTVKVAFSDSDDLFPDVNICLETKSHGNIRFGMFSVIDGIWEVYNDVSAPGVDIPPEILEAIWEEPILLAAANNIKKLHLGELRPLWEWNAQWEGADLLDVFGTQLKEGFDVSPEMEKLYQLMRLAWALFES
jgi:hypothetical protein